MAPGSAEKGPRISRAVGRPTIDTPVGGRRVPEISAPRRSHLIRNLAVGVGAAALTASGVGLAINAGRGNGPQPTENPGGAIVEPSNSAIPTPFPTENPTVTLPPTPTPEVTPTPTAEPTLKPTENLTALEKTLNSWVDGSYKMPELFKYSYNGKTAALNIGFSDLKAFNNLDLSTTWFSYQGVLLGQQVVDGHLVAYIGQKDSRGNRYYFPMNVRKTDAILPVTISEAPYYMDANDSGNFIFATPTQAQQKIEKNIGRSFRFSVYSGDLPTDIDPKLYPPQSLAEVRSQLKFSRDFERASLLANTGEPYWTAFGSSEFKWLINNVVTKVNPAAIPYAAELAVRVFK